MTIATRSPTSNTGSAWTNPTYAYDDGGAGVATIQSAKPSGNNVWGDYGFSLAGYTITKVRVRYDALTGGNEQIRIDVSWDGGTTWSAQQVTALTGTETTYWYDVTAETAWTPAKLADGQLQVRVDAYTVGGAGSVSLDWLPVEVTYTTGVTHYGAATLAGLGTLAGIGALIKTGLAVLAGTGTLAGIGALTAIGKTTLSGTGVLATIGRRIVTGLATLAGTGTLAAIGQRIVTGLVTLSGVGNLTASAVSTLIGKAILVGAGSISAIGQRIVTGLATLVGVGSMACIGSVGGIIHYGVATLSGSGSLVIKWFVERIYRYEYNAVRTLKHYTHTWEKG